MVLSVVAFFEFATFEKIGGLLGKPGTDLSHTVGSETPIMNEGPYASVRHPMYRAAFFITFSSLLVHPTVQTADLDDYVTAIGKVLKALA